MESDETELLSETNAGQYKFSIIAKFTNPVKYMIRIEEPDGTTANYVCTIEGFKKFGELLLDLHSFAEEKLYITNTKQLKEALTPENIKTYIKFKNSAKFKK